LVRSAGRPPLIGPLRTPAPPTPWPRLLERPWPEFAEGRAGHAQGGGGGGAGECPPPARCGPEGDPSADLGGRRSTRIQPITRGGAGCVDATGGLDWEPGCPRPRPRGTAPCPLVTSGKRFPPLGRGLRPCPAPSPPVDTPDPAECCDHFLDTLLPCDH
jgi:hypothetical protein